jgi:hypothetical protein
MLRFCLEVSDCWLRVRRTGKCRRRAEGRCKYVHDASKVAVCPGWLAGQCKDAACLLQHAHAPALMPVCTFFLQVRHRLKPVPESTPGPYVDPDLQRMWHCMARYTVQYQAYASVPVRCDTTQAQQTPSRI